MMKPPLITIVTPTFNEEHNIEKLYHEINSVIKKIKKYRFELLIIDNASTDKTPALIKKIISSDKKVKAIFNNRNFGHIRSPYYGILQSKGVATIYLASDLQDPPDLIPKFINEWEKGHELVLAVKPLSDGSKMMHFFRKTYYRILGLISDIDVVNDSTGFGLYDSKIISKLKELDEPYPFLRGLLCELGFSAKTLPFKQPRRYSGITKNNFYTLYDIAMLGIINHSKVPIRIAAFTGLIIGLTSIITAFIFLIVKILYWDSFPIGIAPVMIGLFFLIGLLMFFIGILGEYISSIHSYVQKRPLVVEKERLNFDK